MQEAEAVVSSGGGGGSKETTIADFKDVVDEYLKLLATIRQTGHRVNRKDKWIPLLMGLK